MGSSTTLTSSEPMTCPSDRRSRNVSPAWADSRPSILSASLGCPLDSWQTIPTNSGPSTTSHLSVPIALPWLRTFVSCVAS